MLRNPLQPETPTQVGAFSVSLNVKDIYASYAFYQRLGFALTGGNLDRCWAILRKGSTMMGLFQGIVPASTLTVNPGRDQAAQPVDPFTDVRELQRQLQEASVALTVEADPGSSGPAFMMLTDPDGNPILVDQHRCCSSQTSQPLAEP